MPTVSDILRRLDAHAPAASSAAWDPAGLQLGDPTAQVETVAVCHEVTSAVVEAVEAAKPDLVVTYHPLLFHPSNRLVAGRSAQGRAWRLIRAGVSLAVAHTSFDAAPGGTSDALASALGLVDLKPFGLVSPAKSMKIVSFVPADHVEKVTAAMAAVGAGRIGNYSGCSFRSPGVGAFDADDGAAPVVGSGGSNRVDEVRIEMLASASVTDAALAALVAAHPYEEPAYDTYETTSNGRFIGRVGSWPGSFDRLVEAAVTTLGSTGIRITQASDQASMVAVLPGSGSGFISVAAGMGAHVLVTGDVDHHTAVGARDRGLSIIDPGHAASERPGMAALADMVASASGDVEVLDLTGLDPTPWR
jgi:dinuclear metal center YbgI/SA1388 family protein